MKKPRVNTPDLSTCNGKDSINSIHIQMIGTFLHGAQFTADELNNRYDITNSLEIINDLINDGIVELLPGTNEYQFKTGKDFAL